MAHVIKKPMKFRCPIH